MINGLKRVQAAEKEILEKVIEICNSHKLTYFVVGGTLLGAVRHGGFIPWDDDIDISMPRPDFERFVEIAELELKEPFQLNTIKKRQNGFCYYFARAENKAIMLERNATKQKKTIPVWIDIFPLDGVPDDDNTINRWLKEGAFWQRIFDASQYTFLAADEYHQKKLVKSIINNIFYALKLDRLISTEWAWKMLDKVIKRYDYYSSSRVTNFCGRYGKKEIVEKSVFGNGATLQFEGLSVKGPEKYDFYLTQIYGDYMKLPPLTERKQHNICVVEK